MNKKEYPEHVIFMIMKNMQGIGGVPTYKEFYEEFDIQLRAKFGLPTIDQLINSTKEECAKRFNDFLESDDFKNGIREILDKY